MGTTTLDDPEDPFVEYCRKMGALPADEVTMNKMFQLYIYETTGWDGGREDEH